LKLIEHNKLNHIYEMKCYNLGNYMTIIVVIEAVFV